MMPGRTRPRARTCSGTCAATRLAWSLLLGGCALQSAPFSTPSPDQMASLEARLARDTTDVPSGMLLAAGHIAAGRLAEAEGVLQRVHDAVPLDPTVAAALGMTEQALEDYAEADAHYGQFLESRTTGRSAAQIRARRDFIRPHILRLEAAALAARDDAAPYPGDDAVGLAVVPFSFGAAEPDGPAVAAGLAELMSADLRRAGEPVVDQAQVRALIAALGYSPSEPLTVGRALRVGSLLKASAVVFGSIVRLADDGTTLLATVLTPLAGSPAVASLTARGGPGQLLGLHTRLTTAVLLETTGQADLGVAGNIAERETDVPEAVILLGQGLLHTDAARYAEAAEAFGAAVARDDAFAYAAGLARRSRAAAGVGSATLEGAVVDAARVGELERAVTALQARGLSPGSSALRQVGVRERGSVSELLGQDVLGGGVLLEFLLTLPGGTP